MKQVYINGTGSYLPVKQISNHELSKTLDTSHEWIYSRTGISRRHIASEHETTSVMAAKAAEKAIAASTVTADEIDLVLVATCTPDRFFPSVACFVSHNLGMNRPVPAFDISAACSGFIYGMDIAKQYIQSGTAKHVLVIGSEAMSRAVDWTDRGSCILFGDGAGAVVLSASDKPGLLGSVLHASYDNDKSLYYPNVYRGLESTCISMKGNDVFKLAVNIMGNIVEEILEICQLDKSDIQWLIPHQANIRIIQAIAKKLNLPMSQVITTIEEQGNTSAASIPLALDFSIQSNRIQRGDVLLLEAFGAGNTWGAQVVRY